MSLADWEISKLCDPESDRPMLSPFVDQMVREDAERRRVISYGLGSYGYDIRMSDVDVRAFRTHPNGIVDPKNFDANALFDLPIFKDGTGTYCKMPPHSVLLGYSVEYFQLPGDVTGIAYGKSTLARSGIHVLITPLEAGWCGNLVIEVANLTGMQSKLYLKEGIAQIQFTRGRPCKVNYADRAGKYQGQTGLTLAKA